MILSIFMILIFALFIHFIHQKISIPKLIFYLILGILLGPFFLNVLSDEFIDLGPFIRNLALIIILMRAGLKLNVKLLRSMGYKVIILSFIPALIEASIISVLARLLLDFDLNQAILLGIMIASVSPAVIVPHMIKMIEKHPEKTMFKMILSAASIEDAIMIMLFTSFIGSQNVLSTVIQLPIFILTALLVGVLSGYILSKFIKKTKSIMFYLYNIVWIVMLLISITYIQSHHLMISSYLMIFTSAIMLNMYSEKTKTLETFYLPIWEVVEIFLFTLLGTSLLLDYVVDVSILMIVILLVALIIKVIFVYGFHYGETHHDRIFLALAFTPKATVQAVLAPIPLLLGFSQGEIILVFGIISIILTAPLSSFMLEQLSFRWYKK